MKWRRRERVFIPEKYGLLYAKSPQAIEFSDFVRVYFSDCKADGKKLISYVCYADFTKDFQQVLDVKTQIMEDGNLGCFDEHGIFPFSPLHTGKRILAYTSGWSRRVSVSVDTGIGIAESFDQGRTFQRLGEGPVLTSSLDEPFLVIDGFVRQYNGLFHMWYIFGQKWKNYSEGMEPDRVYKIGHAVSKDGIEWEREGKAIVKDRIEDESQALPSVVYYNGLYHMFFCWRYSYDFRKNPQRGYRLGYARSYDLKSWERADKELNFECSLEGWDNEMLCYPNVFVMNQKIYMLYNGNQFGKTGFGVAELEEI